MRKKRKIWKNLYLIKFFSIVKCGFSSRIHHFCENQKIEEGENIG
jgi:hypothetical protein